jgi:hypothetical protein
MFLVTVVQLQSQSSEASELETEMREEESVAGTLPQPK